VSDPIICNKLYTDGELAELLGGTLTAKVKAALKAKKRWYAHEMTEVLLPGFALVRKGLKWRLEKVTEDAAESAEAAQA
jgi:hypothetical protein